MARDRAARRAVAAASLRLIATSALRAAAVVVFAAASTLALGCAPAAITPLPVSSPSVEAARPSAMITVAPALSATSTDAPTPSETRTLAPPEATAKAKTTAAPFPSGYRISIPRLDIDLPIAEGDVRRDVEELRTPEDFAFHLPGTALPGEAGNMYLYAHARRGMFLSLWQARRGDLVFVSGAGTWMAVYVIAEVMPDVAATDVSSTHPTSWPQLTLQTSTGPSPSDPRFVVVALPRDR